MAQKPQDCQEKSCESRRSVCKQWNRLVTPALLNVIFIAPKLLEIFTAISQHGVYRKCPELVFDGRYLDFDLTLDGYRIQLLSHVFASQEESMNKVVTDEILDRGYQTYTNLAEERKMCLKNSDNVVCLCHGLPNMPRMTRVTVQNDWIWHNTYFKMGPTPESMPLTSD